MQRAEQNKWRRRRWRTSLAAGLAALIFLLAVILPPAVRSAEGVVNKIRFTSICIRCGVQMASEFYLVLDTEVAHSEKLLPVSDETLMPGTNAKTCEHDFALVGKRVTGLQKRGHFLHLVRGEPDGDRAFASAEVKQRFSAFATSNPRAANDYLEAMAKQRYAGIIPTNSAVAATVESPGRI